MYSEEMRLRHVWNQSQIPVVINKKKEKLKVRLPFSDDNREWLKTIGKSEPQWLKSERYWVLPKKWLNDFVRESLNKYRKLYIIQAFREQETCAPACWNAIGHECQCSCMGGNHGAGDDGSWFVASDTFAARWGSAYLACRLMTIK